MPYIMGISCCLVLGAGFEPATNGLSSHYSGLWVNRVMYSFVIFSSRRIKILSPKFLTITRFYNLCYRQRVHPWCRPFSHVYSAGWVLVTPHLRLITAYQNILYLSLKNLPHVHSFWISINKKPQDFYLWGYIALYSNAIRYVAL